MSDLTWQQDSNSAFQNQAAGFGAAGSAASVMGLGSMSGFVTQRRVDPNNPNSRVQTEWDTRTLATQSLQFASAAAGGVASFSAAAGPFGAFIGTGLSMLSTGIQGGLNAYDAQGCIGELKKLLATARQKRFDDLCTTIEWIIGKQGVKRNKGVANASIAGQPLKTLYNAGKGAYKLAKGTKGVNRAAKADHLMELAQQQTPEGAMAREVIAVVVKEDFQKFLRSSLANAFKSG